MNNIQLSLILEQYADRIGSELAEIEDGLPDEIAEKCKNVFGHECIEYPILSGLNHILHDLRAAVELLRRTENNSSRFIV